MLSLSPPALLRVVRQSRGPSERAMHLGACFGVGFCSFFNAFKTAKVKIFPFNPDLSPPFSGGFVQRYAFHPAATAHPNALISLILCRRGLSQVHPSIVSSVTAYVVNVNARTGA